MLGLFYHGEACCLLSQLAEWASRIDRDVAAVKLEKCVL